MRNSILLKSLFLMALWLVCLGQMTAQNVAKIGTTEYATLQDAVDAAYEMTGDVTIDIIADFTDVDNLEVLLNIRNDTSLGFPVWCDGHFFSLFHP